MATKYFNPSAAGAASVGTLVCVTALADNDGNTITIAGVVYTLGIDFIMTGSTSPTDAGNRIVAGLPIVDYTAVNVTGTVTITWNSVGAANNTTITTSLDPGNLTVAGFSGGVDAATGGGNIGAGGNGSLFDNTENTIPADAASRSAATTDDIVLQADATAGSRTCHDLSSSGGTNTGAAITISGTSTALVNGGSIIAAPQPDDQYVLAGHGSPGTLTLPGVTFVASPATGGPATYGVGGTGSIGTLTLTSAGNVLSTAAAFGIGGSSVTGTYVVVAASNVKSGVTFGAGGSQTGTLASGGGGAVALNYGVFRS